ncbi:MAG: hypothetical protein JNN20_06215 [Betaproteobacteria bacterium]|nr:hypothetical protein [Betaproteobacteria bacterium]
MKPRAPLYLLITICALLFTSGCSTVRVNFDLDINVTGRDADGRAWQSEPKDITTRLLSARSSSSFPLKQYDHPAFRWIVSMGAQTFGGSIRSKLDSPVCFRFDQARISSNMRQDDIPFGVFDSFQIQAPQPPMPAYRVDRTKMKWPPGFCFAPISNAFDTFWFMPDLSLLFPNKRMFNVTWQEFEIEKMQRGKGNWLKLKVPVEYQGKREELEFTFTVIDAEARYVYGVF